MYVALLSECANYVRTNRYGLRLIVYINASEYLPTTEAAGIKMTIHEKTEYPFPDTFGYNAPVGYISSFGIKLKRMERLAAPFGECMQDEEGRGDESTIFVGGSRRRKRNFFLVLSKCPPASVMFIYTDYQYSTEACFRSCYQSLAMKNCKCGDPRFPLLPGNEYCKVHRQIKTLFTSRKYRQSILRRGTVSTLRRRQKMNKAMRYVVAYSRASTMQFNRIVDILYL